MERRIETVVYSLSCSLCIRESLVSVECHVHWRRQNCVEMWLARSLIKRLRLILLYSRPTWLSPKTSTQRHPPRAPSQPPASYHTLLHTSLDSNQRHPSAAATRYLPNQYLLAKTSSSCNNPCPASFNSLRYSSIMFIRQRRDSMQSFSRHKFRVHDACEPSSVQSAQRLDRSN